AGHHSCESVINFFKSFLRRLDHVVGQHLNLTDVRHPVGPAVKGEGNDKFFRVQVKIGKRVMGTGEGKKKKVAEQNASEDALLRLKVIKPDLDATK
ncbi:MAG: putative dsRNA-binding protein, partial [Bacteroidota bacterium]